MMKTVILLVLANAALNVLSPTFWKGSRATVLSIVKNNGVKNGISDETRLLSYSKKGISFIEKTLSSEHFQGYRFNKMLGKGTFGMAFEGEKEGQKIAVKFMFDNADYELCTNAYNAYKKISSIDNVKYLIKIEDPVHHSDNQFNACTMIMERALPSAEQMFTSYTPEDLDLNTEKLMRFALRLVEAFSIINFKGHMYHADVKPDNIMFVVKDDGEIEPRIIDFDFAFVKEAPGYNPGHIIYSLMFRPPELKGIVKGKNPTKAEEIELANYVYNDEYKEEAWAVGASLESIVRVNLGYINPRIERFGKMMEIIRNMMENQVLKRISTLEAFNELSKIMNCKKVMI